MTHRRRAGALGLGLFCAAAFAAAAGPAHAQSPGARICDETAYRSITEALAAMDAEPPLPAFLDENGVPVDPGPPPEPMSRRFDFACYSVSEICALPGTLRADLRRIGEASDEQRSLLVLRAVTADPALLTTACGATYAGTFADLGALAPEARSAAFLAGCQPGVSGLASPEELAGVGFERLLLGAVVYRWLAANDEPHAAELGRMLLGFGLTSAPAGAELEATPPSPGTP
jgi:hypothetical protein